MKVRANQAGRVWMNTRLRVHWHWLLSVGSALALYVLTLAPTVTGEDGGELITAAYYFGVPHPPGYPLWTLLCGIWLHVLPFGNIAWRANLFSAMCTATAIGLLAATLRHFGFRRIACAGAAITCSATATIWSQAVIAEVYGLNLFWMCAILYVAARWHLDHRSGWLVIASLLFGLGMANHHILGFAALACAMWILYQDPGYLRQLRLIGLCVGSFALGLTPYTYLLWAGPRNAPANWGDITSWSALIEHVSRGQYRSQNPVEAPVPMTVALMAGRCYYALRWIACEFTPIVIPVLAAGFAWLRRPTRKHLFQLAILLLVCCGPVYLWIGGPRLDRQDQFVQKVFLTPLAIALAIPLAGGWQWLSCAVRKIKMRTFGSPVRWSLATAIVATPLAWHYRENDMGRYWYAVDHAKNILACLERDAILIPSGDHNTFPLIYLVYVESERSDVTIADKYGYIDLPLYREMPNNPGKPRSPEERRDIEQWIIKTSNRPVYYTSKTQSPLADQAIYPVGLVYGVSSVPLDNDRCWSRIHYRNLDRGDAPIDLAASNIIADYHYARGMRHLQRNDWAAAQAAFADCAQVARGFKEVFNNIGSAIAEGGHVEEAIRFYESAAKMDWRYAPARWNLARIFKSSGHYAWSAKVFEDLTIAAPRDFRPFGELGFLYRDHFGDIGRAKYWWYESIRLNPRQPQIIAALAESTGSDSTTPATPPSPIDAVTTTQPTMQNIPLSSGEGRIDFGEIVEGDSPRRIVRIGNDGKEDVTLRLPSATCACLEATLTIRGIAAGGSSALSVVLHSGGKTGHVQETLTLGTDPPIDQPLILRVQAMVIPRVSVSPAAWEVAIRPGQDLAPQDLVVRHAKGDSFEVVDAMSSHPQVTLSWPDGRHAEHHIVARPPVSLEKDLGGNITIRTSVSGTRDLVVPFAFRTAALARAEPALVYLGRIKATDDLRRVIRIEPTQSGGELKPQLERDRPVPGLKASLEREGGDSGAWLLSISLERDRARPGVVSEVLRVRLAGNNQTLEIPVHGYISE